MGAQVLDSGMGPGQMVHFLLGSMQKMGAQRSIRSHKRLGLVQGLCAHLAHMVDPHQRAGERSFLRQQARAMGCRRVPLVGRGGGAA